MWPKFYDYSEKSGGSLKCPACDGFYIHHTKVEIFGRKDRAADGVHLSFENNEASVDGDLSGNPSRDRGGVLIHFECENCISKFALSVSQHKGNTWMDLKLTSANLGHVDHYPYSGSDEPDGR